MIALPSRAGGHWLALALVLLLAGCGTTALVTAPSNPDFALHQQAVLAVQDWQLNGRLTVRQNRDSDRVSLNWLQHADRFDITLWGTLGLGSTRIAGSETGAVTIEQANEAPLQLAGLQQLSREYLSFDFPAGYLLYWARGLPAPGLPSSFMFDINNLLTTLSQRDPGGRSWELSFDRYRTAGNLNLPGRIRVTSGDLQLILVVDAWDLMPPGID